MDADVQYTDVASVSGSGGSARGLFCCDKGDKDTDQLHKDSQFWLEHKD